VGVDVNASLRLQPAQKHARLEEVGDVVEEPAIGAAPDSHGQEQRPGYPAGPAQQRTQERAAEADEPHREHRAGQDQLRAIGFVDELGLLHRAQGEPGNLDPQRLERLNFPPDEGVAGRRVMIDEVRDLHGPSVPDHRESGSRRNRVIALTYVANLGWAGLVLAVRKRSLAAGSPR
jgi:hypothetical protein